MNLVISGREYLLEEGGISKVEADALSASITKIFIRWRMPPMNSTMRRGAICW